VPQVTRHRNASALVSMMELSMAAPLASEEPTVFLQQLDDVPHLHILQRSGLTRLRETWLMERVDRQSAIPPRLWLTNRLTAILWFRQALRRRVATSGARVLGDVGR